MANSGQASFVQIDKKFCHSFDEKVGKNPQMFNYPLIFEKFCNK